MKIDNKILYVSLFLTMSIFANDKITLQLKWLHQFQFAGYYAAQEKGFYKEAGLEVAIKERNLDENYITKVSENEGYYGIADSILLLYKVKKSPIVIVSTVFQHSPSILITLKESGLDSPYKFDNKKMLFYENDTDGFNILSMLKKVDAMPQLMRKREPGDYKKLMDGTVDIMPAYSSNEPFYFKEKNVPINIISPSNYGLDLYGDMIFTSKKEAKLHAKRVENFKKASLKGWKYALEHKEEIARLILEKYSKRKSFQHLIHEANAIEKVILQETIPLGTLDKGRLRYISNFFSEYTDKKIENIDFENFVFEEANNFYGFSEEELEYLGKKPVVKVQNLDFFPPYNFNENGKPKGFVVDYLKYISSLINIEFKFINASSWSNYEELITSKEIDLIPNIAITKKRKEHILYSDFNYISYTPAIVNKKSMNLSNTLEDLDGKAVAVLENSFLERILEKRYPNIFLLGVSSSTKAVEMVLEGKADLALGNLSTFEYIIQKNWYTNLIITKAISEHIPSMVELPMGYSKENKILKSILEKVNDKISITRIDEIKEKWSNIAAEQDALKLSEKEKNYLERKKNIRVCIDPEWMPFEKIENSKIVGMAADYLSYFEKKLDTPFDLVATKSWTQTLEYLEKRRCDFIPITIQEEKREEFLNFSKPYIFSPLVLATRLEESFVGDIPSTYGKKIGYVKNYAYASILRSKYPELELVEVSSIEDGLEKVKDEEIFGLLGVLGSIGYYIQKDYIGDLKISGKFDENWNFSVGVRNDEPLLLSIIDKTLNTIFPHEHKKIYENWVSVKYQESIDYENILIIGGVLFLIIVIILYKNRTINMINTNMGKYIKIIDDNVLTTSTDTEGNITYVSKAFLEMSQYKKEELIGKNHNIVRHDDMEKEVFKELWETIKKGKEWKGEIKNRKKDGGYFWTNTVITPEFNNKNEVVAYTAVREDITDKKIIEEISIRDGLTDIYNRRYFNEIFPKYINNAKRNNEIVTFIVMDIDHFKQYNDNYGHQKGDEALIYVANYLKSISKRADDYSFRLGGEEFGLLYKTDDITKAKDLAMKILKGIEELHIEHKANSASSYITVSMGVFCEYANSIVDLEELYKSTDELLYKAKNQGRNQVVFNQ